MPDPSTEKNFAYFQRSVYSTICARYVELWPGANEDTFIQKMLGPMAFGNDIGDGFIEDCIQKNSMYPKDLVIVACGYLADATRAILFRQNHLAWSYLMDAQRYISAATYAVQLRQDMPDMEDQAAQDALRSSKSKGGQKTNEPGRIIGDKAIELIKAKAAQGHSWPRPRDAVRCIKTELWPLMQEQEPDRVEDNYERSVLGHVNKRYSEIAQFFTEVRPRYRTT